MTTRNWFITGTSSGFGRALTEQLLENGDCVCATLRKPDALNELKARYGKRLRVAALDVTDVVAIRRIVAQAFRDLGRIDVIVNNAGYGLAGAAEELSDEQIRRQIDTNLLGSIQVTRAALPYLRSQGGGRILQVSSMGGQIAYPGLSLYHTTKWAIEGFFESVAQEIAPFNIEVTLIEPGSARTGFFGGGNLVVAPTLEAYADTPAAGLRRRRAAGELQTPGDPVKMVKAMIASVHQSPAPKRLALGSDAYEMIRAALTERLAALEAQKDIALSTDFV
jgi:NAD(P)-dependent dehydrogenase (short-subunit alcohol dehydrogenase family)